MQALQVKASAINSIDFDSNVLRSKYQYNTNDVWNGLIHET